MTSGQNPGVTASDRAAWQPEAGPLVRPGIPRRAVVVAVLLIALHAVLAWLGRPPGIATRQDDATYLLLAESLSGGGYQGLSSCESESRFPGEAPVTSEGGAARTKDSAGHMPGARAEMPKLVVARVDRC